MAAENNDNFEYILKLTRALATDLKESRQETEKIEMLFRKMCKDANVSYEQLNHEPDPEDLEIFNSLKTQPVMDMKYENYRMLQEIQYQDFVYEGINSLIIQIQDLFASITSFLKDEKVNRETTLQDFEQKYAKRVAEYHAQIDELSNRSIDQLPQLKSELESVLKTISSTMEE